MEKHTGCKKKPDLYWKLIGENLILLQDKSLINYEVKIKIHQSFYETKIYMNIKLNLIITIIKQVNKLILMKMKNKYNLILYNMKQIFQRN